MQRVATSFSSTVCILKALELSLLAVSLEPAVQIIAARLVDQQFPAPVN
jgi:hypothetical protein